VSKHYMVNIIASGSGRGKTLIGTKLTEVLKLNNIPVTVIKHSVKGLDIPGKDTYRYLNSGALLVIGLSGDDVAVFMRRGNMDLSHILSLVNVRTYIVLIEGLRECKECSSVAIVDSAEELGELRKFSRDIIAVVDRRGRCYEYRDVPCFTLSNINELAKLITDLATKKALQSLPNRDCGLCKFGTCSRLAHEVILGRASLGDCALLSNVELRVNDEVVDLNPFVKKLLTNTVLGFIDSLKGVSRPVKKVLININL